MARFLLIVLVLGGIFVAIGFWQGWFTASRTGDGVSISFHKDELAGDWDNANAKVKEIATRAAEEIKGLIDKDDDGTSTLAGKVVRVAPDRDTITVATDGKEVELPMLVTERLEHLESLVGKDVKLELEKRDGAVVIRDITVL